MSKRHPFSIDFKSGNIEKSHGAREAGAEQSTDFWHKIAK